MKRLLATLSTCLAVTASCSQGNTTVAPPSRAPVSAEYFGLVLHSTVVPQKRPSGDRLTAWPSVPFGSWRLWDVRVLWPNLEPERGRWNFAMLDRYVALAEQHGVEVVLTLAMTPTWASVRPEEKGAYGMGFSAPPKDIEDWRSFVRTVAQRYKGRIRSFELWNEVNYPSYFSGTQDELVALARIAHQTLKAIDPSNVLTSPAVVGDRGHLDWLDSYLGRGGKDFADVLAYHFYVPKGRPEDMLPIIARVRQIMAKHGLDARPLWNTETGWWIKNAVAEPKLTAVDPTWKQLDADLAAAYVVRAYVLGAAAGLERFHWYAWDNPDMGLVDAGDQALKPAARAYAAVRNLLVGATFESCSSDMGAWTCRLALVGGQPALLAWRAGDDRGRMKLPPGWARASVEQVLDGNRYVAADDIEIGPQPVVVRQLAEQRPVVRPGARP